VINVSWQDALAYTEWLSEQTGEAYRLPTEAEWEYAARAGTETPFWTGDCIHTDQANYDGNHDYADCGARTGVYREQTVPVGTLPANPWGLHEVLGNVWEWTGSGYDAGYGGGESRLLSKKDANVVVLRGGSWVDDPRYLRAAIRFRSRPDYRDPDVGFRLARTFSP
jgi:formylglycine-generating enzyme required for sulfatase activity